MILLLNNKEQVLQIVDDADIFENNESVRISDENYISYTLQAETSTIKQGILNDVVFVLVGEGDDFQAYFISKIETNNSRTLFTGVSAILEELKKTVVPKIEGRTTLKVALEKALAGTGVTLDIESAVANTMVESSLHYVPAWESIKEFSVYYRFEINFGVDYSEVMNEQHDPYIKKLIVRSNIGVDRPDQAVILGYNAKSFSSNHSRTESITSLHGLGMPITQTNAYKNHIKLVQEKLKERHGRHWESFMPDPGFDENDPPRVDFSDVTWDPNPPSGRPDLKGPVKKPWNDTFVGIDKNSAEMKALGIYDRATETYRHKSNVEIFNDIEDPKELLAATYNVMIKRLRERIYYHAVVDGLNAGIGDTVRIGSEDMFTENIARVIEFTKDNIMKVNREMRIGEHLTTSRNKKAREERDKAGIEPLHTEPTLSTFGNAKFRGLGLDTTQWTPSSLRGIDDMMKGTLPKLSDYGDWGMDEFGNTGLDTFTKDQGLNVPGNGEGSSTGMPWDPNSPGGGGGVGPYTDIVTDSVPVNKAITDEEALAYGVTSSMVVQDEAKLSLGNNGVTSSSGYGLPGEEGYVKREGEHEASITIHGSDGTIDIDKPTFQGVAGLAMNSRDLFIGLQSVNNFGFIPSEHGDVDHDTFGDYGRALREGVYSAYNTDREGSIKSVTEFKDSHLMIGAKVFSKSNRYMMDDHPYSALFQGIILSIGKTNDELENPETSILMTEKDGIYLQNKYTRAMCGNEDLSTNVLKPDGYNLTSDDIHQGSAPPVMEDRFGNISNAQSAPRNYINLNDYIKYVVAGHMDNLGVIENKDILASRKEIDGSALPSMDDITAGVDRVTRDAKGDPGKYLYRELRSHWSTANIHGLSSQVTGAHIRALDTLYSDVFSRAARIPNVENLSFPTYIDRMFPDYTKYVIAHSDSYQRPANGMPGGALRWNSIENRELLLKYLNMSIAGTSITDEINQKQIDQLAAYKEANKPK